jgi:hypothetical protein
MRFFDLFTHARHLLKWFHAGIIARKRVFVDRGKPILGQYSRLACPLKILLGRKRGCPPDSFQKGSFGMK